MQRMNEVAQAAKAFLLDKPEATSRELNEHLLSVALTFLNDKVEDFWHGLEVDHLSDAERNLRELAQASLTLEQQRHLVNTLRVIKAAKARVTEGHGAELLAIVDELNQLATTSGAPVLNLADVQGSSPKEFTRESLYWDELSSIYQAEHSVNLKPASKRDIASAHKTLSRFLKGIDWKTHTRAEVAAARDAMRESGLADSTVNKLLAKLCAVMRWANQNGYVPHDFTKGLKVKGVRSARRAFTEDELSKVMNIINAEREPTKRLFGMLSVITGARCGELTQLTKADIVEGQSGYLCIDINDNKPGKSLKTAASARLVPLIGGAMGFSLQEFREFIEALPGDDSLVFGMSRDVASKWFNEKVLPQALPERTADLVLHSMRHTMATLLKQAGVPESVAGDILGHTAQSMTFGLYGKAKAVDQMGAALCLALRGTIKTH